MVHMWPVLGNTLVPSGGVQFLPMSCRINGFRRQNAPEQVLPCCEPCPFVDITSAPLTTTQSHAGVSVSARWPFCLARAVDVTDACSLLPCRFSRPIEPWLTLIFPADSSSGFGYAAPEIPGFFERLTPLQYSSSILRTAECWPELAVPVCSVATFDYWTRTDANLGLLALE